MLMKVKIVSQKKRCYLRVQQQAESGKIQETSSPTSLDNLSVASV